MSWFLHLRLFFAGQAHCICAQVLLSSPVIHLCGGLTHHKFPHLALTDAKGKWLFPTLWITAKQCYEGDVFNIVLVPEDGDM